MPIWLAKRLFIGAEILILAGAAAAGYWAWHMPARDIDPVVKPEDPQAGQEAAAPGPVLSEDGFVSHLETEFPADSGPKEGGTENPPPPPPGGWQAEVKKHLKLKGTFIDDHPLGSIAVITWKEKEDLYNIADKIPDLQNVKVLTISADNIEVGDKTGLVQVALSAAAPGRPVKAVVPKHAPRPRQGTGPKVKVNVIKHSPGRYSVPRRIIEPYLSRPEKIWTEIRVTPQTNEQGDVSGYQLNMVRPESILHKLGMKAGDTITRVNGQGPINLVSILQKPELRNLKIEYIRAGRHQSVACEIE